MADITQCANCNVMIGALEQRHAYWGKTVCSACLQRLEGGSQASATERVAAGVERIAKSAASGTEKYVGTWRQLKVLLFILLVVAPAVVFASYALGIIGHR